MKNFNLVFMIYILLLTGCVSKEIQVNNKELSLIATKMEREHPRFSQYKGIVRVIECNDDIQHINCQIDYNESTKKSKEKIVIDKSKEQIVNSFYISQYECDQNKVYCVMLETKFQSKTLSQEEIVEKILKQTEIIIQNINKK